MTTGARSRNRPRNPWPLAGLIGLLLVVLVGYLVGSGGAGEDTTPRSVPTASSSPSGGPSTGPGAPSESGSPVGTDDRSGLPLVGLADLPPEAADTLDLIAADGPFPHDEDGETFFNREGLLPAADTGYYREYTVPTPGEDDRGARRLVTGGAGEVYWTADHYDSFARVADVALDRFGPAGLGARLGHDLLDDRPGP